MDDWIEINRDERHIKRERAKLKARPRIHKRTQ